MGKKPEELQKGEEYGKKKNYQEIISKLALGPRRTVTYPPTQQENFQGDSL